MFVHMFESQKVFYLFHGEYTEYADEVIQLGAKVGLALREKQMVATLCADCIF